MVGLDLHYLCLSILFEYKAIVLEKFKFILCSHLHVSDNVLWYWLVF